MKGEGGLRSFGVYRAPDTGVLKSGGVVSEIQ